MGSVHYSVDSLLKSLDLEKYIPLFEDQEINMDAFLVLSEADLKEIGITLVGHRKQILNAIANCRADLQTRGEYSALGFAPAGGVGATVGGGGAFYSPSLAQAAGNTPSVTTHLRPPQTSGRLLDARGR